MVVCLLACLNPHVDPVLGRWERARGVGVICAGRIICLVEIQNHATGGLDFRVQEAAIAASTAVRREF